MSNSDSNKKQMSNSDSNKKQPTKKSNNSYSLLLQGLNEVKKTKPPTKSSSSSKKPKDNSSSHSVGSPEKTMNNDSPEKSSSNNNDKAGEIQDPDVPDRSYGDYYCKLCDSHMNSDNMWDAHITGKRHIKNVKKGDTESKYEDLPDVESTIKYELRNVKDPVVGLSYIHEIRRKEPNVPPIYNCFLCHASIATVPLVTEHVISMKHRLNYIKENNPDEYQLIEATNLKKGHMEPLVIEAARKMEQQVGRGTVKVKQEKKKDPVSTWGTGYHKKSFNLDDDLYEDRYQKSYPKNPNFEELGPPPDVWKSVDTGRSFGRRERSRSPRDFRQRSRSKSPRDFRERKRMYSGDDHSVDSYKRSYSKRDRSPSPLRDTYDHRSFSKRAVSPEEDYHSFRSKTDDYLQPSRKSDDYLQPSRKSDSHDRSSYISPRYESPNPRESSNISYPSASYQKSASSFQSQENYMSPRERPVDNPPQPAPKSFEAVFEETLLLSSEDCYKLFYLRLKSLPEISRIGEMLALTKLISEAQKKLKSKLSEEFVAALVDYPKSHNTTNMIPGLGDVMSSSAKPHDRTDNAQKASNAASFMNDIFKSINFSTKMPATQDKPSFPYSLPTSYAPAITTQQPPLGNTYQAPPPASYQAPAPANPYQGASTSSYPNQAPYQLPNPNMQFLSGSIPGRNPNEKSIPQSQVYNYSHYSSASASQTSKNFPRKY